LNEKKKQDARREKRALKRLGKNYYEEDYDED
jgi:hypothetical protein